LKSGSEINSLQNSLQGAIKEEPGAKDQTTSVLLPTRIPHRRHHLISARKKLKHTSPTQLLPTESHLQFTTKPSLEEQEIEEDAGTTTVPAVNIFDGQYHEVNPGQYNETNPGQYHEENPGQYNEKNPGHYEETDEGQYYEINPGQYEAVVEYNAEGETKSYNVHRKTGDYIIGEVGKINVNNGETLEKCFRVFATQQWKEW